MLVMERKIGQQIMVGDNVVITIVDVARGKVKIGVTAPREIPVFREELLTSISGHGAGPAPKPIALTPGQPRRTCGHCGATKATR